MYFAKDVCWFLLDTVHADYDAAIAEAKERHNYSFDGMLSITLNDVGTSALVKIAGADATWRAGTLAGWADKIGGVTLDIYNSKTDHGRALTMVRNDAGWANFRNP